MNAQKALIAALHYYNIEIIAVEDNRITVGRGYNIEIESNGLYKLFSYESVIAPFDNVDELCHFILL